MKFLPFDTDCLGMPCGEVDGSGDILYYWDCNSVGYDFVKLRTSDLSLIHRAQDVGFRYIETHVRLSYSGVVPKNEFVPGYWVSSLIPEHLEPCRKLVERFMVNNRYFKDPKILNSAAIMLKCKWLENRFDGYAVWCLETGVVVGFVTMWGGDIDLICVDTGHQRLGLGTILVRNLGFSSCYVGTQVDNPSLNFFLGLGFEVVLVEPTFHWHRR